MFCAFAKLTRWEGVSRIESLGLEWDAMVELSETCERSLMASVGQPNTSSPSAQFQVSGLVPASLTYLLRELLRL